MMCSNKVADGFQPGVHATTYGGNPLVCGAALTVLETIESENLMENSRLVGGLSCGITRTADRAF